MSKMPLIAVSPNAFPAEDRAFYKNKALEYGEASMGASVAGAGGIPLMAYRAGITGADELTAHAEAVIERVQGLLLTGGMDVSPGMYGEVPKNPRWAGDPLRDAWEFALYRAALKLGRPILGVCRGHQVINVAEGGSLWQDLVTMREGSEIHRSQEKYDALGHKIIFDGPSRVRTWFDGEPHTINSIHHQGVCRLAEGFRAVAHSPDGVIEAIEREGDSWVVGVQWHPEWMQDRAPHRRAFEALVAQALIKLNAGPSNP